MSKPCKHPKFNFTARMLDVAYPETDKTYEMIEVTAQCRLCGEDYVFLDMETQEVAEGYIHYSAHVSLDGKRAYLPVAMATEIELIGREVN